jgi:MFS family permease
MDGKFRLIIIVIFALLLTGGIIAAFIFEGLIQDESGWNYAAIVPGVLVLILAVVFIGKNWKGVKSGLPLKDERIKMIETRAAALAFYVGIYWLLALMFYAGMAETRPDWPQISTGSLPGMGITGMGIFFAIFYGYYHQKSKKGHEQ